MERRYRGRLAYPVSDRAVRRQDVVGGQWLAAFGLYLAQKGRAPRLGEPYTNSQILAPRLTDRTPYRQGCLDEAPQLGGAGHPGGKRIAELVCGYSIAQWDGVTVTGSPLRVTKLAFAVRRLSGEIPEELGDLTHLQSLDLSYNDLSGAIPAELGRLIYLKTLDLSFNELSGGIPPELGSLSSLLELDLYSNQLSGGIPVELDRLSSLLELDLSGNELSGAIPAELGILANLQTLYLSGNELSGAIPAELGILANLQTLYLSGNELSGEIPRELGNLTNLCELSLLGNQLSGGVPAELGSLSKLQTLDLSLMHRVCCKAKSGENTPYGTIAVNTLILELLPRVWYKCPG